LNQVCIFIRQFPDDKAPEIVNDSDIPGDFTVFAVPFISCISPSSTDEEVAERLPLGAVGGIEITRDVFGCVYGDAVRLSAKVWAEVDGSFLLARPLEALIAVPEGTFSRLWRNVTKKKCKYCHVFDHDEGLKWRHQKTHKFDDGSTAEMWDDVLSMVAKDYDVTVIPDEHIGYCRLKEAIVDARNKPCESFKR